MKICLVGFQLFLADRQKDRLKKIKPKIMTLKIHFVPHSKHAAYRLQIPINNV